MNFAIVSASRTGSTLLAKALNKIPGAVCQDELLLPGQVRESRDGFDPFTATAEQRKSRRHVQVEIDINDFQTRCTQLEDVRQRVIQLIGDRPLIDLLYEELSSDTGSVVAGICQMLALESLPEPITPALKKVGTDDLARSVSSCNQLLDNEMSRHWAQLN